MQPVSQALDEVKALYEKVLGKPAPEIMPGSFLAFPPGVDPLDHALREVNQLKQWSEQMTFAPRPAAWIPPVDSYLTKDALIFRMEIPGVERDTLKVFVVGGECVVRGERKRREPTSDVRPIHLERAWGAFERRFALPVGSRTDSVKARYADGELEVEIAVDGMVGPRETNIEVT